MEKKTQSEKEVTVNKEEQLQKELQKVAEDKMKSAQEKVNNFLQELAKDGFGLDANILVERNRVTPNIFLVRIK